MKSQEQWPFTEESQVPGTGLYTSAPFNPSTVTDTPILQLRRQKLREAKLLSFPGEEEGRIFQNCTEYIG